MSFHKAIKSGKEHRKPFRGSKAFDYSCHNHGSCPWCLGNRTHFDHKRRSVADERMRRWELDLLEDNMEHWTGKGDEAIFVGDRVMDTSTDLFNLTVVEISGDGIAYCEGDDGEEYGIPVDFLEIQD